MFVAEKGSMLLRYDYCVAGSSLVPTTNGLIRLDSLHEGLSDIKVAGLGGEAKAVKWTDSGEKPVIKVRSKSGNEIVCTGNHELLVFRDGDLQWIRADECTKDDYLCLNSSAVVRNTPLALNLTEYKELVKRNNRSGYNNIDIAKNGTFTVRINNRNLDTKRYVRFGIKTLDEAIAHRDEKNAEFGFDTSRAYMKLTRPAAMTPDLAFILGCVVSEGTVYTDSTYKKVSFPNTDLALIEKYCQCFKNVFGVVPLTRLKMPAGAEMTIVGRKTKSTKDFYEATLRSTELGNWLEELGLYAGTGRVDGKTSSHRKYVPWSILQADAESQNAFLAAYLEGDGTINAVGGELSWYSASNELVCGIRAILNSRGIITSYDRTPTVHAVRLGRNQSYQIWRDLEKHMVTKKIAAPPPNPRKFARIGGLPPAIARNISPEVQKKIDALALWFTPIVSIEDAGVERVYDLTMDKSCEPAFVANGLIVHNCAHEVRIWSIASGDMVLAESFRAGQKLRQQYIAAMTDEERAEIKNELKTKGDLHIQNVFRFMGKWVDKDDPLRDAIKAIIFGVLYGKSAATLGVDTKQSDLGKFKGDIARLYDESINPETSPERFVEINRMLEELDHKLTALVAEDRTEYAQGIIDKMFGEFKKGAAWTNKMQELAEKEYYVYSPIGRRRYLPAALTGSRQIVAQQVRRGSNAPIQGFASEIGIKASRLIMESYYEQMDAFMELWKSESTDWEMRTKYNRVVHDANYFAVPYEMLIPMFHISQYMATYGVTKAYKDQFNVDFTVEPEVEFELGAHDANSYKVDWSLGGFVDAIKKTLAESEELGLLDGTKEDILDVVMYPWKNKKFRAYLQEHFPLLGVSDLDEQIVSALKGATYETVQVNS
jgi:intein/homing endonuclease